MPWTFPQQPGLLSQEQLEGLTTQLDYLRVVARALADAAWYGQDGAPIVMAERYPQERQRFLEALAPILRDLALTPEERAQLVLPSPKPQ